MVCVFIKELVLNAQQQGSPISLKVRQRLPHVADTQELISHRSAGGQSNAWAIRKRSHQPGQSVPALHEKCLWTIILDSDGMYVFFPLFLIYRNVLGSILPS
jgi:hypothetical protein